MFGLFGKGELENGSFNNALIASISESVRKNGRFPTEDELFSTMSGLIKGPIWATHAGIKSAL